MEPKDKAASGIFGEVVAIFEIDDPGRITSPEVRERALETLESGGILYFPQADFALTARERDLVSDASVTMPTRRERESRNGRPTVIYDPERGSILGSRIKPPEREKIETVLARYSDWAGRIVNRLFPEYARDLVRDRTTYRPCERSIPQGLHVDASYGRPTAGRGMLRVFCNINPMQRPRSWRIGETFEPFARRFVPSTRVRPVGRLDTMLARLGITKGKRTAYDRLMEDIRGQAKRDETYQSRSPQKVIEFPAGAAWIAITDLVIHGAISGQHSLDQTFFLPPQAMRHPERSSLRILERLTGRQLV